MRSYSELFLKPSLLVVMVGLNACSDKAFQSAVYTDPDRVKHQNASASVEATSTDDKSNQSKWHDLLRGKKDSSTASTDNNTATTPVSATVPLAAPAIPAPTDSDSFATRRSQAKKALQSAETNSDATVTAPKKEAAKASVSDAAVSNIIELNYTTESVDGTNFHNVIQQLTSQSDLSKDNTSNLETLNQGSLHIHLTPRDDMNHRYSLVGDLTLNTETLDDDSNPKEVKKLVSFKNLGNVMENPHGTYNAIVHLNNSNSTLVRLQITPASGEIDLVSVNGDTKILSLIREK